MNGGDFLFAALVVAALFVARQPPAPPPPPAPTVMYCHRDGIAGPCRDLPEALSL